MHGDAVGDLDDEIDNDNLKSAMICGDKWLGYKWLAAVLEREIRQ
jgi:hypothetical protein